MTGVVAHWDDVDGRHREAGDIDAVWHDLGSAAGTVRIGLNRIRIEPGRRSTPAHVHGAEEEIFHVLDGSGLLWQDGETCEVGPATPSPTWPDAETHTLRAGDDGLDVLAFGTRVPIELCYLPRAGYAWAGPTVVESPGLQEPVPARRCRRRVRVPRARAAPRERGRAGRREPIPAGPGRVRRDLGAPPARATPASSRSTASRGG